MKKFGLIGYPLSHSFSARYFSDKFKRENIRDCSYANFEISSLTALPEVLKDPELRGLNVTIPYKESVIPFLHKKDPAVAEISACNCIRIDEGILTGYNTDIIGFESSWSEKLLPGDKRALILGTGGASKAVAWVLRKKNIPFLFVSRKKTAAANQVSYDYLNAGMMAMYQMIINTTPLGTTPHTAEAAPIPYDGIGREHYLFDLVYNPDKTLFLKKGEAAGARIKNGADMLAIQAEANWVIWNQH